MNPSPPRLPWPTDKGLCVAYALEGPGAFGEKPNFTPTQYT